jgi:hydroxyacylglutathione hydrolase
MLDHQDQVQTGSRLTVVDFAERQREITNLQVVDVRNPGEVADGTIPGSVAIPVGQLPARVEELDPSRPTVVYCAGGYRSSVAASLLRHRGFVDVSDVRGGYNAWIETLQSA